MWSRNGKLYKCQVALLGSKTLLLVQTQIVVIQMQHRVVHSPLFFFLSNRFKVRAEDADRERGQRAASAHIWAARSANEKNYRMLQQSRGNQQAKKNMNSMCTNTHVGLKCFIKTKTIKLSFIYNKFCLICTITAPFSCRHLKWGKWGWVGNDG